MNTKPPVLWIVLLCVCCALLEYAPFPGFAQSARVFEFGLFPVAAAVAYLGPAHAVAAALVSGLVLDTGSALPVHLPVFAAYAATGLFVSRHFYSPRSLFHIAAQAALIAAAHFALYACALYPWTWNDFEWVSCARAAGMNAAAGCVILILWPIRKRKFSVYRA